MDKGEKEESLQKKNRKSDGKRLWIVLITRYAGHSREFMNMRQKKGTTWNGFQISF